MTLADTGCTGGHDKGLAPADKQQGCLTLKDERGKERKKASAVKGSSSSYYYYYYCCYHYYCFGKSIYCSECSQAVPAGPSGKDPYLVAWDRAPASVNPHILLCVLPRPSSYLKLDHNQFLSSSQSLTTLSAWAADILPVSGISWHIQVAKHSALSVLLCQYTIHTAGMHSCSYACHKGVCGSGV